MNFKAFSLPNKPYIYWQSWDGALDALVISESAIPLNKFGVCPMKIVNGQLENRTAEEMAVFETEYNANQVQATYEQKGNTLKTSVFRYDGVDFPMHETARIYYSCIARTPAAYKVMSTTGQYNLADTNVSAFLAAYFNQLTTLTQP